MTDEVRTAITEELAKLERVIDPPSGDPGYGSDLSCVTDITPDAREVDSSSLRALAESNLRRLNTRRGTVVDAPNFGEDVLGMLNQPTQAADIPEKEGRIRSELLKDERNKEVNVLVLAVSLTKFRVTINVVPSDPRLQPFTQIFAIENGALTIEQIGA